MFKITEKTELNKISLTGMRALVLLGLLIEAPRTMEEIKKAFIEFNIIEAGQPEDILRIDLNTLREMECDITKATAKTDYKYVLKKHPFALKITQEEIALLKKVYKKVKDCSNIVLLLKYDELFKKLASHVTDNTIKEQLYGLSILKSFDLEFIHELIDDCKNQRILKLIYRNPELKKESEKKVSAQKIVFQNDKIYLYGYDIEKSESVILNVKRIKSILSRILGGSGIEVKTTCVKFFLKNFGVTDIEENETVIETCKDGFIIEGKYHNEFVAVQRILSFGSNCTVMEPQEFKEKIIKKLKEMRKNYNE